MLGGYEVHNTIVGPDGSFIKQEQWSLVSFSLIVQVQAAGDADYRSHDAVTMRSQHNNLLVIFLIHRHSFQ